MLPESLNDRSRKLAHSLSFLHAPWASGEYNIAHVYQMMHTTDIGAQKPFWLVLQRPKNLSSEDCHMLDHVGQAHAQMKPACKLARAIAQMIRSKNAHALRPWLAEVANCGVPELRTFATGIKRDRATVLAALTYSWSQGS